MSISYHGDTDDISSLLEARWEQTRSALGMPISLASLIGVDPLGGDDCVPVLQELAQRLGTAQVSIECGFGTFRFSQSYTFPTTVTLRFSRGCIFTADSGVTVTLPRVQGVGRHQNLSGDGTFVFGEVPDVILPETFGAVGDYDKATGTDNTATLAAAINASGGKVPVLLDGGADYLVTGTLPTTATQFMIHGSRKQRGMNAHNDEIGSYNSSTLSFRPATNTPYMIDIFDTANKEFALGPFELLNIKFDFGGDTVAPVPHGNGLRFGADALAYPSGQARINGLHIEGCDFNGRPSVRTSDTGVITRTGQTLLKLNACFEAKVDDNSFRGGDVQIEGFANDRSMLDRGRSSASQVPIRMTPHTSTGVQNVIDRWQIESWGFAGIVNVGGGCLVRAPRMEQPAAGDGEGVYDMAADLTMTCAVTQGSTTVVFDRDMTGILWPDLSILRLTNASGESFDAMVGAVATTNVTLLGNIYPPWTDAVASPTRIHGGGVYHVAKAGVNADSTTVEGASMNPHKGAPAVAMVPRIGQMRVSDMTAINPADGSVYTSLVLGNYRQGTYYQAENLVMSNCDPLVQADASNPFVKILDTPGNYGMALDPEVAAPTGDFAAGLHSTRNAWIFTPGNYSSTYQQTESIPVVQLAKDVESSERLWAWFRYGNTNNLALHNAALPTNPDTYIRTRIKARAAGRAPLFTGTDTSDLVEADLDGGSVGASTITFFNDNGTITLDGTETVAIIVTDSSWTITTVAGVVYVATKSGTTITVAIGNSAIAVSFTGDGANQAIVATTGIPLTTAWSVYEDIRLVPSQWQTAATPRGFLVGTPGTPAADDEWYLASITVEELILSPNLVSVETLSGNGTFSYGAYDTWSLLPSGVDPNFNPSGAFPDGFIGQFINRSATRYVILDSTGAAALLAPSQSRRLYHHSGAWQNLDEFDHPTTETVNNLDTIVSAVHNVTLLDGSAGGIAATLGSPVGNVPVGFKKRIIMINTVNNALITITNCNVGDGIVYRFNTQDQFLAVEWTGSEWFVETDQAYGEYVTTASPTLTLSRESHFDTTSTAIAATLPDGAYPGQQKYCRLDVRPGANDVTLTITNHETSSPEVLTYSAVGHESLFIWSGTVWTTQYNTAAT